MKGQIVTVLSTVVGNGSKYVAPRLAKEIYKNYDDEESKVLLIDFDFDHPYLGIKLIDEEAPKTIDDLFPLLRDELEKDISLIKEYVIETLIDGVDLLKGTRFPQLTKHLSPEYIKLVFKAAREIYDHIIVVVSPAPNNLATIYSLIEADKVVLINRQNETNVGRLPNMIKMLRQYYTKQEHIRVLYNFDSDYTDADTTELLENSYLPIKVVATLEYEAKSVDNNDLLKQKGLFQKHSNAKSIACLYEDLFEGGD